MSHEHRKADHRNFEGQPTAARFSFYQSKIERRDLSIGNDMRKQRAIVYKAPTAEKLSFRAALEKKGLVLGTPASDTFSHKESFLIPTAARPINHDVGVRSSGEFSYDDRALFTELGSMLRVLSGFDNRSLELKGPISENVAFVEFTRVGENKLFFVPGFEHQLEETSKSNEDILEQYVRQLHDEFGDRFTRNVEEFAQGFEG